MSENEMIPVNTQNDRSAVIYRNLINYIQQKKCVLVLGPELSVDKNGNDYRSYFKDLSANNKDSVGHYFAAENLFSFKDYLGEATVREDVREFYNSVGDLPLLETIARIKFPLIINVCPDISLNKVYAAQGIDFNEAYFSEGVMTDNNVEKPTFIKPFIYNIFGSISSDQSLILTHGKLYRTIEALMPANSLPEPLEVFLQGCDGFILLGFDFDSWYYQLICHKLKIKVQTGTKMSLSTSECNQKSMISLVMNKHFDVQFTKDNSSQVMQTIISELYQRDSTLLRSKLENGRYSIYLSYAHSDQDGDKDKIDRASIVNLLETDLRSHADPHQSLNVFRDRNDLTYGDSIDSYIARIGNGKAVIMTISDKYLKSVYCMDEAMRIFKHNDRDKRIFIVMLKDFSVDQESIALYKEYWRNRCLSIFDKDQSNLHDDNYDVYLNIYRFIDRFFTRIKDAIFFELSLSDMDLQNGNISVKGNKRNEYQEFKDVIIEKLKE